MTTAWSGGGKLKVIQTKRENFSHENLKFSFMTLLSEIKNNFSCHRACKIKNIKVNKENVQLIAISDLTTKTQLSAICKYS
jgi:hypothetical protein